MAKNPNARKVILSDLDSTISHVHHREHLAPATDRELLESWIDYSRACIDDEVIEGVAQALRLYREAGYSIGFVSGRNVEAEEETKQWLTKNNIPFDFVRLHTPEDPRHNAEHKVKYIESLQSYGFEVVLMFEDHVSVCQEITEKTGVPCVTVKPHYDDGVGVSFNLSQYTDGNYTVLENVK